MSYLTLKCTKFNFD